MPTSLMAMFCCHPRCGFWCRLFSHIRSCRCGCRARYNGCWGCRGRLVGRRCLRPIFPINIPTFRVNFLIEAVVDDDCLVSSLVLDLDVDLEALDVEIPIDLGWFLPLSAEPLHVSLRMTNPVMWVCVARFDVDYFLSSPVVEVDVDLVLLDVHLWLYLMLCCCLSSACRCPYFADKPCDVKGFVRESPWWRCSFENSAQHTKYDVGNPTGRCWCGSYLLPSLWCRPSLPKTVCCQYCPWFWSWIFVVDDVVRVSLTALQVWQS